MMAGDEDEMRCTRAERTSGRYGEWVVDIEEGKKRGERYVEGQEEKERFSGIE